MFIIQESMKLDALQASVEAITTSITSMHPDMHVCILAYSHRIGIYRLEMLLLLLLMMMMMF